MGCEWIVILKRDGVEVGNHQFHADTEQEAVEKAELFIKKEHAERQSEFPFTKEYPANAVLFREFRKW